MQDIDSKEAVAAVQQGAQYPIMCRCLSPDGRSLFAFDAHYNLVLYPIGGGHAAASQHSQRVGRTTNAVDRRRQKLRLRGDRCVRSTLRHRDRETLTIATFSPADPAGFRALLRVRASADLRTFVYSYRRDLSQLVLVRGLK
jgi:hypothetical protein